jgi:hypothetical protein
LDSNTTISFDCSHTGKKRERKTVGHFVFILFPSIGETGEKKIRLIGIGERWRRRKTKRYRITVGEREKGKNKITMAGVTKLQLLLIIIIQLVKTFTFIINL